MIAVSLIQRTTALVLSKLFPVDHAASSPFEAHASARSRGIPYFLVQHALGEPAGWVQLVLGERAAIGRRASASRISGIDQLRPVWT
jgi:hypothetical protein